MHRATPLNTAFVSYVSGGARTLIDTVDDGKMMQEMAGTMMFGEARDKVEAPQNYGFTSVVRPATKDKNGKIQASAEGFMSFMGGNRSFPVCSIMDDRRYRPYGLKPGENAQYDDLGQMTLLRRTGLFLLSNDNAEDGQQSGGATPTQHDSGGGSQSTARMVSIRHVQKSKQKRAQPGQAQSSGTSGQQQDFKHEGDTVNTEMRVTSGRIEFRSGDTVVGYYDKASATWCFIGKVKLGSEDAQHPAYGVSNGVGMTSDPQGQDAVLINATKPGPPTSLDTKP